MNKSKQQIFRNYPDGYTGDSTGNLNRLLYDGWRVLSSVTVSTDKGGRVITDYLLEKELSEND
jgi:hypothetical protein